MTITPHEEVAAFAISTKMAKALADRWRSRILMELSVRPLSPSQFVELAGGDLSHIARCFRQLKEWDFIEVSEIRRGGHRRGGIEHVYRPTRRALFDTQVWGELSKEHKDECTSSTLLSYIARISEAVKAGTFDDELDRHLSWDVVLLDRVGWSELIARLDGLLLGLPNRALEASKRHAATPAEMIPTTVGLAGFRSPVGPAGQIPRFDVDEVGPVVPSPYAISAKLAKALANEWRARIIFELRVRQMSPTQFVKEIGGQDRHIRRCFRQLTEWNYIEVTETKSGGRRRGGTEKFYRLKRRAIFTTPEWEQIPRFLRDECSAAFLDSYFKRVSEAIKAETLDAEPDRHLSWDGVMLDRIGWTEVVAELDALLNWLPELDRESSARIEKTGDEPIPTTVGLTCFRSPAASARK